MENKPITNTALFVMPHFVKANDQRSEVFVKEAVDGLFSQSDKNWKACIVDDNSTNRDAIIYLKELAEEYPEKFEVIFLKHNVGPGVARNIAVSVAKQNNHPFILYNDSDDISHPNRLEMTRSAFQANPEIGLVYSSFEVIDEDNNLRSMSEIPTSILEVYESYKNNDILEGGNVWVDMGTKTGYLNKTSATSVLTSMAAECPFPNSRASEDFSVWMRLSAKGAHYKYVPGIATRYRVPTYLKQQNSRSCLGNPMFNRIKVQIDVLAFEQSIDIALSSNSLDEKESNRLRSEFYFRLAKSMRRQDEKELEDSLLDRGREYEKIYQMWDEVFL